MRRGSGRRTTAGYHWARKSPRKQAFVPIFWPSGLRSASAGLANSLFHSIPGRCARLSPQQKRGKRQNRRANGTSAGEKRSGDDHLCSELGSFPPATGDRSIACRSAVSFSFAPKSQRPPLRVGGWMGGLRVFVFVFATGASGFICVICVICGQKGWAGGSVPSLCLCGSVVFRADGVKEARGWRCRGRRGQSGRAPVRIRRGRR